MASLEGLNKLKIIGGKCLVNRLPRAVGHSSPADLNNRGALCEQELNTSKAYVTGGMYG